MVHRSFWTSIDAGNTACNIVMSHSPIAVCTVQITIQVQLLPNHLSINLGAIFPHYLCCKYFVNRIPFTVVIFYLISPIPTLIAKRRGEDSSGYAPFDKLLFQCKEGFHPYFPSRSNPCRELAWFLTTGIVVSAFALPIVLARAPVAVSASFSLTNNMETPPYKYP